MQPVYRNDRSSVIPGARRHQTRSRLAARADEPARANDFDDRRTNVGADLTRRQMQVLALLAKGEPNKTIARALSITEGTVKIHLTAIFKALRVQNRSQAAVASVTAALRPDIASEPDAPGSVRGWPRRHPFDNTGRGHALAYSFKTVPGTVLDADF